MAGYLTQRDAAFLKLKRPSVVSATQVIDANVGIQRTARLQNFLSIRHISRGATTGIRPMLSTPY